MAFPSVSGQHIDRLHNIDGGWSIGLLLRHIPSLHDVHFLVRHANHIGMLFVGDANALAAVVAEMLRIDATK